MSLFDIFCAIWRFIAQVIGVVLETAIETITILAKAFITLLFDVLEAVGDGPNGLFDGGLGGWIVIGALLFVGYKVIVAATDRKDNDSYSGAS